MAKRKTRQRKSKKRDAAEKKSGSPFWRQAFAFALILIAFFLFLGGLDVGGILPVRLFEGMSWLFGFAAYFSPIILVYLAIVKFRDEEHIIPFGKILGSVMVLVSMAAVFHVFVSPEKSSQLAGEATYGGQTGHFVNSLILSALSTGTAFVLYMLLMLVSFLFTFSIAPKKFVLFIISLLKRKDRDTDLSDLKQHTGEKIDVKENVPVEHHRGELEPGASRLSSFKNTAQKLSPAEDHTALTVQSDPNWQFPGIDLLNQKQDKADAGDVQGNADIIRETLRNFKIDVEMEGANVGPRVTQFTLRPPNGVKLQKITALDSNIALDLAARSIRIEAPIPGKKAVGIEVPNVRAATVRIASILSSDEWQKLNSPLGFTVGKDIAGSAITGSLEKMPHLLIAGQTGSGKSVMINSLLTSLLYRNSPSDLKLILVDPKQVELTPYNDVPHLLTPVITEPEKCISALKWAVAEMERRLRAFADAGKRNISEYNSAQTGEAMPYIVIVIDELADLMMVAARDVEALVVRIAQKSRAAGIHLVLATQRPSVDVITGLIKANVPARIAFTVASQIDSRTIIDMAGAEKLLGTGDMLYLTSDMPKPIRVQGALITHAETIKVTDFLRMQQGPSYDDEVVSQPVQLNGKGGIVVGHSLNDEVDDTAWEDAVRVVIEHKKASTSYLQRRLRIGYSRAARLIETMEEQGIVGPADGARPREVLVSNIDEVLGRNEIPSSEEVYDDMPDEQEDDNAKFS